MLNERVVKREKCHTMLYKRFAKFTYFINFLLIVTYPKRQKKVICGSTQSVDHWKDSKHFTNDAIIVPDNHIIIAEVSQKDGTRSFLKGCPG